MADEWKCLRCSTSNGSDAFSCVRCGLLRGSAVPAAFLTDLPADDRPSRADDSAPADVGAYEPARDSSPAAPQSPGTDRPWLPPADRAESDGAPAVPGWIEPEPVSGWRRLPLGIMAGIAIAIAVGAAGWYFAAGRSSTGEIEKTGDLAASELRVGDCFDLKDPEADEVEDVTARPCADEHEYEAFFVGVLAEGPYPADPDAVFPGYVEENCLPAFGAYVGRDYNDSELEIFWFYPMEEAWSAGDRSVQCAAYHPRVNRLTGSLRDSDR